MNTKTNKLPRPTRAPRRSLILITSSGYKVGTALSALRKAEEHRLDLCADVQEGAPYSPNAFDRVNLRCIGAQRQLKQAKQAAGLL